MTQPLPRGVAAPGLVSLFMDISSGMAHSLLPVAMLGLLAPRARTR